MTLPTFSDPCLDAEFSDWPIGGGNRGCCKFRVTCSRGKQRVERTTQNKFGQWCKPKCTTYADYFCIVDGINGNDDWKTYLLSYSEDFRGIVVWMYDCKHTLATLFPGYDQYDVLLELVMRRHRAVAQE